MKALLAVIITALAWSAAPAYAAVAVLTCEPEWAALATEIGAHERAADLRRERGPLGLAREDGDRRVRGRRRPSECSDNHS